MIDSQFAQLLNDKYALSQVTEKATTPISTIYAAANTWGNQTAEVELFGEALGEEASASIAHLAGSLEWLEDPAVARIRDCGVTPAGQLYVIRDEVGGNPLRSLIDGRVSWGTPFTYSEAERLLAPVARAVDRFNASGHPNFLARSIDPDFLLVQPGSPAVPVVLTMAGPTAGAAGLVSEAKNRRRFADVVSQLTAQPVDEELLETTGSAAGYLDALANPPAPAPQYWEPQQQFPDTDPGMEAVTEQYVQADYPLVHEAPKPKRKAWPWVLASVLLLGGAGAGGYWWYSQNGATEPWKGGDAEIAQAFPQLVSQEDGGQGFNGMTCHSQSAEGDAEAKIRCSNSDAGVSIFKYSSAEQRDASIAADGERERFGNDACQFTSAELTGQNLPAYFLAPEGDLATYSFLVNGENAQQLRLQLPIC